jgi:glycosyltransferase involved in cell wall biosynthesis
MDTPLISIIIPYYGMGKFLQRALEGISDQTYHNWELVLVDDCSPDVKGKKIILDFKKECTKNKIEYYRNAINSGQGISRNNGMRISSGEYIAFLDPDDYWHRDYLKNMLESIGNADLCAANAIVVDEEGEAQGEYFGKTWEEHRDKFPFSLSGGNFLIPSATVIRKETWERTTGFSPKKKMRGVEDWDFYLRCLSLNMQFTLIKNNLCYYRKHQGGFTHNKPNMWPGATAVLTSNWRLFQGEMRMMLKKTLYGHLCWMTYINASFRNGSSILYFGKAFFLNPMDTEVWKSLYRGLRNNWKDVDKSQ